MKIPSLIALAGLALGFTAPAFAQQKDTPDPALVKAAAHSCQVYDAVYNNNDPEALANLFTEDAVLVTDSGIFHGGMNSKISKGRLKGLPFQRP